MKSKVNGNDYEPPGGCEREIERLREELARAEYREEVLERKVYEVPQELMRVSKILEEVLNSNSWRLTLPLRIVMQKIRARKKQ